jgi:hypothetical protein
VKDRESETGWPVWGPGFSANEYVILNNTNAKSTTDGSNYFPSAPTSSVVNLGPWTSPDGKDSIAYCFAPVAGYSAIGSYEGNNSSDGKFIYTGFRVRWLLIKNIDNSTNRHWTIIDTARSTYNATDEEPVLFPDENSAESPADNNFGQFGSKNAVDFLSNGFKVREPDTSNVYTQVNKDGDTHIYLAIAENPFQANGGLAR